MSAGVVIRDLHSIADFREVMALEHEIWGYGEPEDAVGIPVFVITIKRGGILLGAYDAGRMVGFVYSLAGLKRGMPVQWSHMLGVRQEYRGTGLGRDLKFAQRQRALAMGIDLMEWTYDPLQAVNAHLNFARLGAIVEEYHVNVYGDSSSTLHRGNPTDRFIAQWWMRSPRVARLAGAPTLADDVRSPGPSPRLDASQTRSGQAGPGFTTPKPREGGSPPIVLQVGVSGEWSEPARVELGRSEPDLLAAVPGRFTEMLEREPGLADAWRLASRETFTHYLGRAYRVVGFEFDAASGGGSYVLSAARPADLDG